jgi:hypothetical protein
MRRMRAEPAVPVEVAWRRGKNSRRQHRRKQAALSLLRCGQSSHMSTNRPWRITGPTALPHGRILPSRRGCLMGNLTLLYVCRALGSWNILRREPSSLQVGADRLIKHLWRGLRLRGGAESWLKPGVRSKRCCQARPLTGWVDSQSESDRGR